MKRCAHCHTNVVLKEHINRMKERKRERVKRTHDQDKSKTQTHRKVIIKILYVENGRKRENKKEKREKRMKENY